MYSNSGTERPVAPPPTVIPAAADEVLTPQMEDLVEHPQSGGTSIVRRVTNDLDHGCSALPSTPEPIVREAADILGRHLHTHLAKDTP